MTQVPHIDWSPTGNPLVETRHGLWPLFRRKPRVVSCRCRKCGRHMNVVAGSVPYRERECNLCVYAEARRVAAEQPTLLDLH